jgi:hypothetical protein
MPNFDEQWSPSATRILCGCLSILLGADDSFGCCSISQVTGNVFEFGWNHFKAGGPGVGSWELGGNLTDLGGRWWPIGEFLSGGDDSASCTSARPEELPVAEEDWGMLIEGHLTRVCWRSAESSISKASCAICVGLESISDFWCLVWTAVPSPCKVAPVASEPTDAEVGFEISSSVVPVSSTIPVSTTIKSPTSSSTRDLFLLGRLVVRLVLAWEVGSRSALLWDNVSKYPLYTVKVILIYM